MNYQQFIDEQTALTDISLAYKHDPEFQKQIDANPKSIFHSDTVKEIAEMQCEIVIMHNSDEVFYFTLRRNMNYMLEDEEIDYIQAAKLSYVTVSGMNDSGYGLSRQIMQDEDGVLYRRYKQDSSDPSGHTHFVKVSKHFANKGHSVYYRDESGPMVMK